MTPSRITRAREARASLSRQFESLLDSHRGIVFKLAAAYCPRHEEREDLAQEICLQLWRAYPRYDRERRFSTWMYRVALNTAISFARRARTRRDRSVPIEGIPEGAAEPGSIAADPIGMGGSAAVPESDPSGAEHRIAELYRFIHGLDELNRALIVLHLEDRSYREIGKILGVSETNVGTKLGRLKNEMRRDLAPKGETIDGTR